MSKGGGTLKELEKRLRDEPDNLVLRVTVAGAMCEAGRVAEAVELYRSVAFAYRDQNRTLQAVAVCRSILALAPDDARCKALLDELLEPPPPDALPPIRLASKFAPTPDEPEPPRRPEVLITRISSSDRLDETPLPMPMPYHVAEPTAAIPRLTPSEMRAVMSRPTPTFVRARESNPPTPTNPTPVHVLTRELGDPETTRPHDTRLLDAARGSKSSLIDVTSELDTRQRPRMTAEEVAKLAPPPTGPIPRIATPLPIIRDSSTGEPTATDDHTDRSVLHDDDDGVFDMPTESMAAQPHPDDETHTATDHGPGHDTDHEPAPLPPVRVSSKPGIKQIPSILDAKPKHHTTGPLPLPAVPPPPDPVEADNEDELTQPREHLFDPRSAPPRRAQTSVEPVATRFFAHLPAERRAAALSRFHRRVVSPYDVVIAKDAAGHPFVLVVRGELEVRPDRGRPYRVGPGEFAGEQSLLQRTPSTATVIAMAPSQVLLLLPADFYEMVGAFPALWAELKDVAARRAGFY